MTKPFTMIDDTTHLTAGQRVQLHPGTDLWMRGDRYATITGVSPRGIRVELEMTGRHLTLQRKSLWQMQEAP